MRIRKPMSSLQNDRLCAALSVIAVLSMKLGIWLMSGDFGFKVVGDGITLIFVVWLATGSTIARWIVGSLTAIASIIVIGGLIWLFAGGLDPRTLETRQKLSFVPVVLYALINAFVAWRLMIWNRCSKGEIKDAKLNGSTQ